MATTGQESKNFQVYDDLGCYDQRELVAESAQPQSEVQKNFQVYPDGGNRTTGDVCDSQPTTVVNKNFQIQRSATCVRRLATE